MVGLDFGGHIGDGTDAVLVSPHVFLDSLAINGGGHLAGDYFIWASGYKRNELIAGFNAHGQTKKTS